MATSGEDKALRQELERLRKENALLRDLVSVLRELPANRDREIETVMPPDTATEAEAPKPRKRKSRERGALPEGPGVVSPPSS